MRTAIMGATVLGMVLLGGCGPGSVSDSNKSPTSNPSSKSPSETKTKANTALSGEVKVDGSSTVYPITSAAASAFSEKFPNVAVNVGRTGTGGGFKKFVQGETDISDASRPIKPDEMAECSKRGIAFLEIPVAYDGIAVCVHKENSFIDQISIEDLKKLFSADIAIKSWKDLNPAFPDRAPKIFMPDTESGTYEYFRDVVVGKEGKIREDVTPSSEDLVLVNGISNEKFAVGFFGASYFFQAKGKLKALSVIDPSTGQPISLSLESIENSTYAPFGRPLFIYVNLASMKRPEVKRFVQFYLDNAADLCRSVQCVPLSSDLHKLARSRLDDVRPGTYFYDDSGKIRSGKLVDIYQEANLIQPK